VSPVSASDTTVKAATRVYSAMVASRSGLAADRPIVELQLVAARIDDALAVIGAGGLVELRRDHEAHARRIRFVHRDG
jgi:hypothetical protein